MNNGEYLDHTFTIGSCDIDIWGKLKPTAILNICQEAAYMHSSSLGFGYDSLMQLNCAWVLSRVKAEIDRLPEWRENIRVRTWHKRRSGLFALRDYIFYDQEENPIIRVTTSWLIINIKTRRISRVDRVFSSDEPFQLIEYTHNAIETEAEKVEMPTDAVFAGEHKVVYSDIDLNKHVNNVKYLEWACDLSPRQLQPISQLSHFCINFNHEATISQKINFSSATPSKDSIIIEGVIADKDIFTAELRYRE